MWVYLLPPIVLIIFAIIVKCIQGHSGAAAAHKWWWWGRSRRILPSRGGQRGIQAPRLRELPDETSPLIIYTPLPHSKWVYLTTLDQRGKWLTASPPTTAQGGIIPRFEEFTGKMNQKWLIEPVGRNGGGGSTDSSNDYPIRLRSAAGRRLRVHCEERNETTGERKCSVQMSSEWRPGDQSDWLYRDSLQIGNRFFVKQNDDEEEKIYLYSEAARSSGQVLLAASDNPLLELLESTYWVFAHVADSGATFSTAIPPYCNSSCSYGSACAEKGHMCWLWKDNEWLCCSKEP